MSAVLLQGERLKFVLPDFLRLCWVSDHARAAWAPRIRRVLTAWAVIERESVTYGLRKCALQKASSQAAALGDTAGPSELVALPLVPDQDTPEAATHFAVGAPARAEELRQAWLAQEHDRIGELLGYPACCTAAFRERCVSGDFMDITWVAATPRENTAATEPIEIQSSPICNLMWRWVGLRAVPHLCCRFDCIASARLGEDFLALGRRLGFTLEIEWLLEILSWPVEWSALHGIAEIRTPIFRLSTVTDATAGKLTVRWTGSSYPAEGAQGVRFPYRIPSRAMVTESPAYLRGLEAHSKLVQLNLEKA
jgi:hypothetical protein